MYKEVSVLRAVARVEAPVPTVLHEGVGFQIQTLVDGVRLDQRFPLGSRVPGAIVDQLASSIDGLSQVPRSTIDLIPKPVRFFRTPYSSCRGFAEALTGWFSRVYTTSEARVHEALETVGVPEDPFAGLIPSRMASRQLRLCHGDLSRTNCLVEDDDLKILDWELALWGDPAWDVAAHLHRFQYPEDQEEEVCRRLARSSACGDLSEFLTDVRFYRRVEVLRTTVVNLVRLARARGDYPSAWLREDVERVAAMRPSHGIQIEDAVEEISRILEI